MIQMMIGVDFILIGIVFLILINKIRDMEKLIERRLNDEEYGSKSIRSNGK